MINSNRLLNVVVALTALCAIGMAAWVGVSVRQLQSEVHSAIQRSQDATIELGSEMTKVREGIESLVKDTEKIAMLTGEYEIQDDEPDPPFHTLNDVKTKIRSLGKKSSADKLAETISALEDWWVDPEADVEVRKIKLLVLEHLRAVVSHEMIGLQRQALGAANGTAAAEKLAEAGRVLALYPMSEEQTVIEKARKLAESQLKVGRRLLGLQRQRYNRWAIGNIESAISHHNEEAKGWTTQSEKERLVDALGKDLGPIDPVFLEPIVLDLYSYVLDKARETLDSEENQILLAKKLTAGTEKRKALSEF